MATDGDDALSTSADGETLAGLAGNDTLTSTYNATTLLGDEGDDALTTTLYFGSEWVLDAWATQRGGTGKDRLSASIGVSGGSATITLAGDDGDDQLKARAYISEAVFFGPVHLKTDVSGGTGNDVIDVQANLGGGADGTASNSVSGGDGDDQITAFASTFFFGFNSTATNVIDGDDGNDTINATAIGFSNGGDIASNLLTGGSGDDLIRGLVLTDSNSSSAVGLNRLSGGDGSDTLEAIHKTDGENYQTDVTSELDGGAGNDILIANSLALSAGYVGLTFARHDLLGSSGNDTLTSVILAGGGRYNLSATLLGGADVDTLSSQIDISTPHLSDSVVRNVLDGGLGNDTLDADISIEFSSSDGAAEVLNHLSGGEGDDLLNAYILVNVFDAYEDAPPTYRIGINDLLGGDGHDIMIATIEASTQSSTSVNGASYLSGGLGNDYLAVIGGVNNVLVGGDGDDKMVGSANSDQFVLEFVVQQSTTVETLFFRPNKEGDGALTPSDNASKQAWVNYLEQLASWRQEMLLAYGQDQDSSFTGEAIYKVKKTAGSLGAFDNTYAVGGSLAIVADDGIDTINGWDSADTLRLKGLGNLDFASFDKLFDVQLNQQGGTHLLWAGGSLTINGLSLSNVGDFYSAGVANEWFVV